MNGPGTGGQEQGMDYDKQRNFEILMHSSLFLMIDVDVKDNYGFHEL